eukprot:PhF_6_TR24975/c0_g1_i1/m.34369
MGQGMSGGIMLTVATQVPLFTAQFPMVQCLAAGVTTLGCGLAADIVSDATAREGRVVIPDNVLINANDTILKLHTFYCDNKAHPVAKMVKFQHEWIVMESKQRAWYTIQKTPRGDVRFERFRTLREACDAGLRAADRPIGSGEHKHIRTDTNFLVDAQDLQVAYIIAWARKEDPRWSLTTENARHFSTRFRYAVRDF